MRVLRPLSYFDVGEETKDRPAPIGAAPGIGALEPFVPARGLPFARLAQEIAPHRIARNDAGARADDRLEIRGESFFEPAMGRAERGESNVDHLVGEDS